MRKTIIYFYEDDDDYFYDAEDEMEMPDYDDDVDLCCSCYSIDD